MRTPAAADYQAVKDINLEQLVLRALGGFDSKHERQAVRELLCSSAPILSRLDSDFEVNLNLFTDEFAEQMQQLMALRLRLRSPISPEVRRRLDAEKVRALLQVGSIVFNMYEDEIEKFIDYVVQENPQIQKVEDAA